jgi:hypothetical protein
MKVKIGKLRRLPKVFRQILPGARCAICPQFVRNLSAICPQFVRRPVRNLSGAMNGKALFCRGVTAAAYLDGILGALFSEFVQRPLSSTSKPFPEVSVLEWKTEFQS